MRRARMNGDGDAGREYAEIWGEAVQANRKLRTILIFLSASCVLGVFVLLRLAGTEPPKPIVVRVDEVGRAEAMAYEAATAQADPLDPTTKYFLNRFVADFHSRRRATVEEHWTRSLRFLSTELANAAFARDGDEVAGVAAGTAETERQVERVVLRIHPSPEPPHGATADFELVHLAAGQEMLRERWSLTLRFEFLDSVPPELVVHNPMGILVTYLQADRALVTGEER
ncbi:MAG: VirB8/TrbF family protein [Gammaproteobacteria bacterium]|nr:VirB8/TrbF family protein [Gammaproteobacteria bacterium]